MGYYKPFPARIQRGQRFGDNPNWGPNPPGGHNGDDYLSQVGEPVYAAGDGVVVFAGRFDSTYADNWGWNLNFGGQMVVLNLDGPDGPYVEYGHNSELRVSTGDRVSAGQVIALSGEDDGGTHVITGPHLHVGCLPPNFNLNTNTYGRVSPDLYLTDYPDEAGTISVQSATITPATPAEEDDMFTDSDRAALARIDQRTLDIANGLPSGTYWTDMIGAMGRVDQRTLDNITAVTAIPANVLNQQFTLPDGTKTNLAGILTAINAKPVTASGGTVTNVSADPTAIAAAVIDGVKTQWKK